MSKANTSKSAIKGLEITTLNNSNEKNNGLIYVQKMNEKKYVTHKQYIFPLNCTDNHCKLDFSSFKSCSYLAEYKDVLPQKR